MFDRERQRRGDHDAHDRDRAIEDRAVALVSDGLDWLTAVAEATRAIDAGTTRPAHGAPGKRSQTLGLAVHRKARGQTFVAADAADRVHEARASQGRPLPEPLAAELASALGVEPSALATIRVHDGAASAEAADAIAAEAFTIGTDIHFAAGAYQPDHDAGRRLIAHEVAHAVAQPSVPIAGGDLRVSEADEAHEQAADRFADTFVARPRAATPAVPGVAPPAGLAAPSRAQIHRFEANVTDEERARRARLRRLQRVRGEGPDAASDAAPPTEAAPATAGAQPQAALAPPIAAPAAPGADRPRAGGALDQAVVAAGGDAAARVVEQARRRDGVGPAAPGADPKQAPADRKPPPAPPPQPEPELDEVPDIAAPPAPAAAPPPPARAPGNRGPIEFKETDVERLVPVEPAETPEERAPRVAEARAALEADRAYAQSRLAAFRAGESQKIQALSALAPQIDRGLAAAEQRAVARVTAAASAQVRAVRAAVAQAIGQAQGAAAGARATIQGAYAATASAIETATSNARTQIVTAHDQAVAATRTAETRQLAEVTRLYGQAETAFRNAASAGGNHATSVAAGRARGFRSQRINRDDSFLDGPLTDNRCEARADAAEKVGQAYHDELVKEGDKQVEALRANKPTDEAAVRQVAEEARRNLDTAHTESLRLLDDARQRALTSAGQVRDGALAGTASTLASTIRSLRSHERGQIASIHQTAAQLKRSLHQQRLQGATQLKGSLTKAIADLTAGLDQSLAAIKSAEVPERAGLDQTLAESRQALDGARAKLRTGITQGQRQAGDALAQSAAKGAQGLNRAGAAATSAARRMASGADQAMGQGAQGAAASLRQSAAAHAQATTQLTTSITKGYTDITTGLTQAYGQLSQNLQQGMQRNADAVRTELMAVVDRDMNTTIDEEAAKAAAQVKPRWQSVLKWVIIIAIVLVVAIVLGPMVIGAITGLAAGLGASAAVAGTIGAVVGGAIVGAGTAAVTTMVDNAFSGRPLLEGVGTAMAWGALGGALGGGVSSLLSKPMAAMGGMARWGTELVVDVVVDTGLSALQGNLTLEGFAESLLTSILINGITAHPRIQVRTEASTARGHDAGYRGGDAIRTRTGACEQQRRHQRAGGCDRRPHRADDDQHPHNDAHPGVEWGLRLSRSCLSSRHDLSVPPRRQDRPGHRG